MTADFITVLWKEWKEIVLERSSSGAGSFRPLILVAVLGIFVPFRMGPERYFRPEQLLLPVFLSGVCDYRRHCRFLRRGAGAAYAGDAVG